MENAPMLSQPGSALFLYVAKMAVVEYEKLTSIHANIDPHFYGLTVLSTIGVLSDRNWNALCT